MAKHSKCKHVEKITFASASSELLPPSHFVLPHQHFYKEKLDNTQQFCTRRVMPVFFCFSLLFPNTEHSKKNKNKKESSCVLLEKAFLSIHVQMTPASTKPRMSVQLDNTWVVCPVQRYLVCACLCMCCRPPPPKKKKNTLKR